MHVEVYRLLTEDEEYTLYAQHAVLRECKIKLHESVKIDAKKILLKLKIADSDRVLFEACCNIVRDNNSTYIDLSEHNTVLNLLKSIYSVSYTSAELVIKKKCEVYTAELRLKSV